jgi:GNAT superfamily N-acetyltransferase
MTYLIRPGRPDDVATILRWRTETAAWLSRQYGSDQWTIPFPPERVLATITAGQTFMVHRRDQEAPVATITVNDFADPVLWTPEERADPARYVHKLTVVRSEAGRELGVLLLDWAGQKAATAGARWLRLDCWSTNHHLHAYYRKHGFAHVRTVHERASGALFQRPAGLRTYTGPHKVREADMACADGASPGI